MASSQNSATSSGSAPGAGNGSSSAGVKSGSAQLTGANFAFQFKTQSTLSSFAGADIVLAPSSPQLGAGNQIQDIGNCDLDSLREVPASPAGPNPVTATVGRCYAVLTQSPDNQYAAIRITAVDAPGNTLNFDFRYQPTGSKSFE